MAIKTIDMKSAYKILKKVEKQAKPSTFQCGRNKRTKNLSVWDDIRELKSGIYVSTVPYSDEHVKLVKDVFKQYNNVAFQRSSAPSNMAYAPLGYWNLIVKFPELTKEAQLKIKELNKQIDAIKMLGK